jgi:molybdenum cofactor synthesis domain-containing protein
LRYFPLATNCASLVALGCEVLDLGIVQDRREATRDALLNGAAGTDLVITTGGVSVGEEDHVRIALEEVGELDFWRIAIKPGKPLAFGHIGATPFLGLPGNPVAAFVTFCLFARPFILRLQGVEDVMPIATRAPLLSAYATTTGTGQGRIGGDSNSPAPGFRDPVFHELGEWPGAHSRGCGHGAWNAGGFPAVQRVDLVAAPKV